MLLAALRLMLSCILVGFCARHRVNAGGVTPGAPSGASAAPVVRRLGSRRRRVGPWRGTAGADHPRGGLALHSTCRGRARHCRGRCPSWSGAGGGALERHGRVVAVQGGEHAAQTQSKVWVTIDNEINLTGCCIQSFPLQLHLDPSFS
jgi:hypothetical protein